MCTCKSWSEWLTSDTFMSVSHSSETSQNNEDIVLKGFSCVARLLCAIGLCCCPISYRLESWQHWYMDCVVFAVRNHTLPVGLVYREYIICTGCRKTNHWSLFLKGKLEGKRSDVKKIYLNSPKGSQWSAEYIVLTQTLDLIKGTPARIIHTN